ncbi:translocation/assembly module TamB domain-containing protein [Marinobacter xestospongiae]|uniref:Translocation/assembly module TamB domain-containing protein n=1 Tax=Marinobacter xestospongiae TaxID=994319 RepID=A0ABU3VTQ7_9GAMM|nr:translocation/assembly module TamB domain-containing protein [Marinobacter xestospongiae]MDV2077647.1 translocation/assembly module TamB domain-containing protein [Marinobacter xestospongiae]
MTATVRHPLRWLLLTLLALLAVVVLAIAGVFAMLRSDTGTQWVLEQIPGLTVTAGQGSLLGRWQAESLHWQGYGVIAEVASPLVDWSPTCLFGMELCLEALYAERVDVTLQPSDAEPASGPIQLPELNLPLALTIGEIRLGPVTVNGNQVAQLAVVQATGSGADWQLQRLRYQLDDIDVDARGRLTTRGDWPLHLEVATSLPPPVGDQWRIQLELAGSVADLRFRGQSEGYLNADIEGRTRPLQPALPARVAVTSSRFLAHDSLPLTLALNDWRLALEGSLESGFATELKARLEGNEGPVQLALSGQVGTTGAESVELLLTTAKTAERPAGRVSVNGEVDWSGELDARGELTLDRFPWHSLLPDVTPPPVTLTSLVAGGHYRAGNYQAEAEAQVTGPQGPATVETQFTGDLSAVSLDRVLVTTEAGRAEGSADVGFAGPLTWQASLELAGFNPGYWLPVLEASLDGAVSSQGRVVAGQPPQVAAQWQVAGQWQGQPAEARGQLDAANDRWQVAGLELSVGPNQVSGEGVWARQLEAMLTLAIPQPELLLPGLSGQLSGELTASGSPDRIDGQLRLDGQSLGWQDAVSLASLAVKAEVTDSQRLSATVAGSGLEAAGQTLASLELALNGGIEQHQLTLTTVRDELETYWQFEGGWQDGWQGQLADGRIDLPQQAQQWRLEAPAELVYRQAGPALTLGRHCWRWQQSEVCAGDQQLMPELAIEYRLTDFPTLALSPFFPNTLKWDSRLDGRLAFRLPEAGPQGEVVLAADAGEVEVLVTDAWHTLDYDTLDVRLELMPEAASLDLTLAGPDIGRLVTQVSMDPSSPRYPMTGTFDLADLDIAFLGPMLDLEAVTGMVSGSGKVGGELLSPRLEGELSLVQGSLVDQRLPTPVQDLVLVVRLDGQRADLEGRWAANDRSEARIDGTINWQGSPEMTLSLAGQRLPFNYEPYASVELAPNLSIRYAEGGLTIGGELNVPRGQIEIRQLPEQAVTVSDDEELVGVTREEPALRSLNMNVTVSVGQDEVSFDGFGVTGNLQGGLRLGNDLDTRGSLQLRDGHFEAYGQELELRRARLVFVGPIAEPYLDIEAIRRVDQVVAGLRLSGPVSEPSTEVFSEPSMSQANALSYVILGRPLRSEGDQGQVSQAAISLGLTQASKVTQKIGEEIGIEQLILETEGSGDQASVVASGYLTEDLSLRYGVGIFEPISTIALRYDLGRYFYLEAASGLAASLDIFYTRDF